MSEYIHEIVLQDYIVENILRLNLSVSYKGTSRMNLVDAAFNRTGTFWDLTGKLENGDWIPIEVEWTTKNFPAHKHHRNPNFGRFTKENGVLLVLRKTKELPNVQQISILDSLSESQFKKDFTKWFKKKSSGYVDKTLKTYMAGSYKREIPRIILYSLSQDARKNYFPNNEFYRKNGAGPCLIGFKSSGYDKNAFIRDLQPDDVILFIAADGSRCKRSAFIEKIKNGGLNLDRLAAYRIKRGIADKRGSAVKIDAEYWPDEIKSGRMIYPYICTIEDQPFLTKRNLPFPFLKSYSDGTWEAFRSCIQYGEYREISPLDFTVFISSL